MQTLVMRRGSLSQCGDPSEATTPITAWATHATAALNASLRRRKILANSYPESGFCLSSIPYLIACLTVPSSTLAVLGRSVALAALGLRSFLRDATSHAATHGVAGWFD